MILLSYASSNRLTRVHSNRVAERANYTSFKAIVPQPQFHLLFGILVLEPGSAHHISPLPAGSLLSSNNKGHSGDFEAGGGWHMLLYVFFFFFFKILFIYLRESAHTHTSGGNSRGRGRSRLPAE